MARAFAVLKLITNSNLVDRCTGRSGTTWGNEPKRRTVNWRTLTAYGIGVVIVLAILNGIAWLVGTPWLHSLNVFPAGFVLGMLGTYFGLA
jgi:hypothetical protein